MDKDITEESEENVMSLVPETTTTTQSNLFRGIVNYKFFIMSTEFDKNISD